MQWILDNWGFIATLLAAGGGLIEMRYKVKALEKRVDAVIDDMSSHSASDAEERKVLAQRLEAIFVALAKIETKLEMMEASAAQRAAHNTPQ